MDECRGRGGEGCRHRVTVSGLLLWFGAVMMGSAPLVGAVMGDLVSAPVADGMAILAAGVASIVPLTGVALLTRRRRAPDGTAAAAASLAIAGGYVVLRASVETISPQQIVPVPLRSHYTVAALRLAILWPYVGLSAWLGPRLAGHPGRPMGRLGSVRPRWSTCFVALAAAALVAVPWPLTGALGDSLSSLAIGVEMLSLIVPQVLIFWGVIFVLLNASLARTGVAAVTTILIYALSALGGPLVAGDEGALTSSLFLLPLAFLLAEIRARGKGVLPLLPLALSYELAPVLFVDPRDVIANGIPELQHLLSYLATVLTATTLTLLLWVGRRLSGKRRGSASLDGPRQRAASPVAVALVALGAWGGWMGLYVFAGEPGFFNHGFLIILDQQAELASAYPISGREERVGAVYGALVETAEASQGSIRHELDVLGVAYRPYYIINMIRVDGHRWLMGRFASRPGVARVILNPNVRSYPRRVSLRHGSGGNSKGVQANLAAIRADAAWRMGVLGEGIVVGGQDSGYAWDHPALKSQYRGWDGERADHDYNWHDAWDDTGEPFDDDSHGTHTMGTVLGDDGGENRIGVAPGATWIGCRNMRRGIGNPGSYAECMEFLLAPYPLDGDPFLDGEVRLAAHMVNNSWGCPRIEGCFPGTLRPALEALRAAGIMMVVSAGNEGPACSTATTPPANYDAAFSVGATTNGGNVVGFSSRGPVDGLIKPDITAPGQLVRSSVPGGGYGTASGTSAAGPHVAGTVALIWSANRSLIGDVDATEQLLCRTALPKPVSRACPDTSGPAGPSPCACGGVSGVPNNVYGCGIVDAGAAVERALEE
jgi:subtilisin family serine protease